jgi:predicted dehydrogenase
MNQSPDNNLSSATSRREFLKTTGKAAAVSALAGIVLPHVHAQDSQTINVALVGCGGRGTGAAANALSANEGPIKLVAMADVYKSKLDGSYGQLKGKHKDQVEVPEDRKFIGFDGYKNAIDSLRKGDVAIFTTPLAFRWVHYQYAIDKGVNVFMEKPVTADGPTSRRMLEMNEKAKAKNMKVGVGLMSRHSKHMQQLHEKIRAGELGDILFMRGYRMHGPVASAFSKRWPGQPSELLWQISRFHSFLWASGGCYSDFYIHHIDHCCWLKGAFPVKAQALGGRHYRYAPDGEMWIDQNLDSYAVEYTFEDGTKFYMDGRCNTGAHPMYFSHIHGTKGMAIASKQGDCGGPSSIHNGQSPSRSNMKWQSSVGPKEGDPYQNEWNVLINAIRNDKPHNEVEHGVKSSLATSMGRMAAHTGQEITWEQMMDSDHEFAPGCDKWTMDSQPPVVGDKDGKYPVPMPGKTTKREYEMNIKA